MTYRANISLPDGAREFIKKNSLKPSGLLLKALEKKGFKAKKKKRLKQKKLTAKEVVDSINMTNEYLNPFYSAKVK